MVWVSTRSTSGCVVMTDDLILQQVHDDWKQKGFPYYPKDKKWRDNIFNQLVNFKRDTLVDRRNNITTGT